MEHELTIVIVAYNAEQTIARAVKSAVASGSYPILLIDDASRDATVEVAKQMAGKQISVCQQPENNGVGAARARALEMITTPYGMWLDADDEILADRPETMLAALKAGADIVYDGGLLIDENTGECITQLDIPNFMHESGAEVRCFERNWYPLLHCGFRVDATRSVGFDETFHCAEDYDFLLRAIEKRLAITPLCSIGYRYYHAANSISRNLSQTRKHVKRALEKHSMQRVEALVRDSDLSAEEGCCLLAGMALYNQDYRAAGGYSQRVKDRAGFIAPYMMRAGFYADFINASALAGQGKWQQTHSMLQNLKVQSPAADVWNNLGVCLHRLGEHDKARQAFTKALTLMAGYHDAAQNLEADVPDAWTSHPLRRQASRDDYSS